MGGVVRMVVHVPDVRYVVLLQVAMHALADGDQAVLVTAREPEELELPLRRRRIRNQLRGGPGVRSRGERADPREAVEVRGAGVERLAATHREPGQGAMLA